MQDFTRLILPDVRELLAQGDHEEVARELERLHPADVADLLSHLDPDEGAALFLALSPKDRVEVFGHLDENVQVQLVEKVGRGPMVEVIEALSSDDRTDLMQALPEEIQKEILPLMAQADRNEVQRLMSYPEDSAGALMSTEFASIPPDMTVREALETLRRMAPSRETIYYIYVLDEDKRLVGVLSLKDLVLAHPDDLVGDIMEKDVIAVRVDDDQEDVARAVEKYDFLAIPVVDGLGRMVGIVTQDDVMDVLKEEATEDAQKMAAMEPLETSYLNSGFFELVRKRGTWLVLLFFGELLTSETLAAYEHTWSSLAILVALIPLINSSGGNTGGQSSVLVIRSLALGEITTRDWFRVVLREIGQGLVLGLILAVVGIGRVLLWGDAGDAVPEFRLALAVGLSLLTVVTLGAFLGSTIPMIFKKLGMDPAVMSNPSLSCAMDILGMLTYFNVVGFVLGL